MEIQIEVSVQALIEWLSLEDWIGVVGKGESGMTGPSDKKTMCWANPEL